MAQNQDPGLNNQNDNLRDRNSNLSMSNDDIGENTEQTPVAKAQDDTADGDERIPSVTPYNENGLPGPDDDDDDAALDDDDDDDYEEIIPIEGDDDELEDEYDDEDDDDDVVDETDHPHIDISEVGGDATHRRPSSRTTGTLTDHEPGIPGANNIT